MTRSSAATERASQVDLGVALLAGPGHWLGGGQSITTPMIAVGWAQVLSLVGLGTVITSSWLTVAAPPEPGAALWVTLTWIGVAILAVPLLASMSPGVHRRLPLALSLVLRVAGIVLVVGMSTPLMSGWPILLWWPAALFLGADVSLTMRALGRATDALAPMWSVVLSPLHVVVVVALAIGAIVSDTAWVRSVALVVIATDAVIVAGYAVAYPCLHLMARHERELQAFRTAALEVEYTDRANWIHDDVLGELRLARVRLESGELSAADLLAELDGIEHRLRLKQVDEVLRTGRATVAEILQPFLRMTRSHGVELLRVPTYDIGALRVDEPTGKALKRMFAVPVTNALLAGATSLSVDVRRESDLLVVEIGDDAGGFEPSAEHQGRGLATLEGELGEGSVSVASGEGGTTVTCRVPLSSGSVAG